MNLKKFIEEVLPSKEDIKDAKAIATEAKFNGLIKCNVVVLEQDGKPVIQLYDDNGNLIAIADVRK